MILEYEVITIVIVKLTHFSGPARRMGAGAGGLGSFAMRMGRVAIPVVRRYILPVAKQLGRNLLEAAIPEIGQVLAGKKRPSGKMLNYVAETATKKTVKTSAPRFSGRSVGASVAPQRVARSGGGRVSGSRMACERVARADPRRTGSTNRKRRNMSAASSPESTTSQIISKASPVKRSRSDILSEIQFVDSKTTTTTKERSKQSGPTSSSSNNDFFWLCNGNCEPGHSRRSRFFEAQRVNQLRRLSRSRGFPTCGM